MNQEILSDFRVVSNKVVNFEFNQEEMNAQYEKIDVNIEFNVGYDNLEVIEKAESFLGIINLVIQLVGSEAESNKEIFNIYLRLAGRFESIKDSLSYIEFEEMVRINGIVVMMHQARSFITSTTALAGTTPPIIIPMVNVYELDKAQQDSHQTER